MCAEYDLSWKKLAMGAIATSSCSKIDERREEQAAVNGCRLDMFPESLQGNDTLNLFMGMGYQSCCVKEKVATALNG